MIMLIIMMMTKMRMMTMVMMIMRDPRTGCFDLPCLEQDDVKHNFDGDD